MDKPVKELACEEPKPLQEKSTVEKAGETMRALKAERFPVASGDRLVGTVEGKYLERKAAGFGHDPTTTLVRGSMLKTVYYCFEDQPLEEAREIMRSNNLQHLSVVDADLRVVGTVALTDLEAEQAQQTAEDAKAEG
ncbi:MAG TPA: CBS domain-containing protein [Terrimicrobiaceae bacterium]